jgi:acyl-CoA reductase-like NAD-dependent aldehyde dehydrogenase
MPFKSLISPLIVGNPILLKHAHWTPLCSAAIEKLFIDSGFEEGEF